MFGMTRMTRTPFPSFSSMKPVAIPAAMEMKRVAGSTAPASPERTSAMFCGLTERTTISAPRTAARLSVVALTP